MEHTANLSPARQVAQRRRARKARRSLILRRIAIGAAMVAAPVIAAETALQPSIAQAPAASVELMGFETPGESFPGSAFYYLEDAPPAIDIFAADTASEQSASRSTDALPELGPAAGALIAHGSDRDVVRAQECLATAIYYEAASESAAGQRAVAQVVLNRVAHSAWPSTVCGVVYQGSARQTGCQFSFTCDGSLARRPSRGGWERASRIARAALAGTVYAPVGLSTHYHTLAINPYWAPSLTKTTVVGAHVFYRLPGSAGAQDAFATSYGGGEPAPGGAASQSSGPDPLAIAQAQPAQGDAQDIADGSVQPELGQAATAPEMAVVEDALPASGDVREEYRNAGRWIERP